MLKKNVTKALKTKLHIILNNGSLCLWEFKIQKTLKHLFAISNLKSKNKKIPGGFSKNYTWYAYLGRLTQNSSLE